MISACGKAILLGEHAVVHGHPALAGALDRGVRVRFEARTDGRVTLSIPAWSIDVAADDDHPVAEALAALLDRVGAPAGGLALRADADLPPAAGLGSSAALSVALTRALAAAAGRPLTPEETESVAGAAERRFHENPSGIDVALAARGGLGLYRRGRGLAPLEAPPVPLAVGLSGEPRSTGAMVARVSEALEAAPAATGARLEALGEAARAGAGAVRRGDLESLGRLFDRAQEELAALGLSTAGLDALVDVARRAGALGAKLTGAGGGGAVLALAPGGEEAVLEAWRAAGFDGFRCRAGAGAP